MDPLPAKAVVLSESRLWAESLAFALTEKWGQPVVSATPAEIELAADHPATILVDFGLKADSIFESISDLRAKNRNSKIIVVGLLESAANVLRLANVGAHGYVRPTASLEDLVNVLRAVERGEFMCSSEITFALFLRLQQLSQKDAAGVLGDAGLTARETQIARLLSEDLSNKEIANSLCLSVHTVKNHVHSILTKLGARSRVAAKRRLINLPNPTKAFVT